MKILNKQGEEFNVTLQQMQYESVAIDMNPLDNYDGTTTVYDGQVETGAISQTTIDNFDLLDEETPNRFSKVCVIQDPLNKKLRLVFRDHKENSLIALPMSNLNKDFVEPYSYTEIWYTKLADVEGEMTVRTPVVPTYYRITSFSPHIDCRTVALKINNTDYDTDGEIEYFLNALGSTEAVLGGSAKIRTKSLYPSTSRQWNEANFAIGMKDNKNILIPTNFR